MRQASWHTPARFPREEFRPNLLSADQIVFTKLWRRLSRAGRACTGCRMRSRAHLWLGNARASGSVAVLNEATPGRSNWK